MDPHPRTVPLLTVLLIVVVCILVCAGIAYAYFTQQAAFETQRIASQRVHDRLKERLDASEAQNEGLRSLLEQAANENVAFNTLIEELANTVGYLDKVNKTDRELLQ